MNVRGTCTKTACPFCTLTPTRASNKNADSTANRIAIKKAVIALWSRAWYTIVVEALFKNSKTQE